jgi:hypothetical protein
VKLGKSGENGKMDKTDERAVVKYLQKKKRYDTKLKKSKRIPGPAAPKLQPQAFKSTFTVQTRTTNVYVFGK